MPAPVLGGVLRQAHQRVRKIQSTNDEPPCIIISTDSALAFFSFREHARHVDGSFSAPRPCVRCSQLSWRKGVL